MPQKTKKNTIYKAIITSSLNCSVVMWGVISDVLIARKVV